VVVSPTTLVPLHLTRPINPVQVPRVQDLPDKSRVANVQGGVNVLTRSTSDSKHQMRFGLRALLVEWRLPDLRKQFQASVLQCWYLYARVVPGIYTPASFQT